MNKTQVIQFSNPGALARAVARAWLGEVATAHRAGQPHCVALSGGRIALQFFAAVGELSRAGGVSFAGVHFFWADERCVPPTDPESSFGAADESFFRPLGIASDKIHRIPGEHSPEGAAALANAEVRQFVPLNAAGQPVFDLIFLGMGEDAHVASLFPAEPEPLRADPAIYRAITHSPKPPPNRVTLGYAAIGAARNVWVLASGAGKEAALRKSLLPDANTPLGRVLRLCAVTKIFTDIPVG